MVMSAIGKAPMASCACLMEYMQPMRQQSGLQTVWSREPTHRMMAMLLRFLAVRRPQHGVVRARRRQQPVHLRAADDVGESAVAEQFLGRRVEDLEAGRDDHRADVERQGCRLLREVDALGSAGVDAFHALGALAAVHAALGLLPCLRLRHDLLVAFEGLAARFASAAPVAEPAAARRSALASSSTTFLSVLSRTPSNGTSSDSPFRRRSM